jgi:hypothetical protein
VPSCAVSRTSTQGSDLVGVAGFEPAASSSRTTADSQVRTTERRLTWRFISQHLPASATGIPSPDASVTHADPGAASFRHARIKISTA